MPPYPAKLNAVVYGRFEVSSIPDWRTFMDVMYGLELKPANRRGEFEVVIDDAGSRLLFTEGPAASFEPSTLPA